METQITKKIIDGILSELIKTIEDDINTSESVQYFYRPDTPEGHPKILTSYESNPDTELSKNFIYLGTLKADKMKFAFEFGTFLLTLIEFKNQ
jgi:hypothetical protein